MVPGAGIEPAWAFNGPRDFKSLVSTNFTIRAERRILCKFRPYFVGGHKGLRPSSWLRLIAPTYKFHHPGKQWRVKDSAETPDCEEMEAGVGIEPAYTALQGEIAFNWINSL